MAKELPRYKFIEQFEANLKRNYSRKIGEMIKNIALTINKQISHEK